MDSNMRKIALTRGKFALVNDEDYEELSQYKWQAVPGRYTWYAQRCLSTAESAKPGTTFMHRQLFNGKKGIDHINHDGLDNRRENLRAATGAPNNQNGRKRTGTTSKYRGVCWETRRSKWIASTSFQGKHVRIGYFPSEAAAESP